MKYVCRLLISNDFCFLLLNFSAEENEREMSVPNDTMLELGARSKPVLKMGATYVVDESIALASNSSLGMYDKNGIIFFKHGVTPIV